MDKPIILAIEDAKEKIGKAIIESGLPAFFLVQILHEYETQLIPLKNQEIDTAKKSYEKKQEEDKSKNNKKEGK